MKERQLSLLMDLYELTMANGYFLDGNADDKAVFDVFYRKNPDNGGFAIFAGLEQVISYIENLHFTVEDVDYLRSLGLYDEFFLQYLTDYHFTGHIDAMLEGTIVYPNEPLLTVTAPLIDAQLIETALLAFINHQSLIATKARRIVKAAEGRAVSDFGARRAHNADAAIYGARAAYIGGVSSTATVLAGKQFGIPVSGTMAHSWVMYYKSEKEAFKKFAELYPDNAVLLVDTYNVLDSGVPHAIQVAKEVLEPMGKRLAGVRLDSGDLAYLSQQVRQALDKAGLTDCKIVASNSLDEYTITSLLHQGGCIDMFGVGERLITAKSDPVFGGVYKLAAVEHEGLCQPRIKISETVEKITNPGKKRVYRIYNQEGYAIADLLTLASETVPALLDNYQYIDPQKPWKHRVFTGCVARELQVPVWHDGKRVQKERSLDEIAEFVQGQLDHEVWPEEQRFDNPHVHYLDMSPEYYQMKMELLSHIDRD